MIGLSESVRSAAEELGNLERERETAIAGSRAIIRLSKRVIHAIHTGGDPDTADLREAVGSLMDAVSPEVMLSSVVQDALMEYAEAVIFGSVIEHNRVPSAKELGIPAGAWVLGLADCVGELRRTVTAALMDGDMETAGLHFSRMEEISGELMLLDVPDAVAPVRRKQDIVRGIMDRTRSDMTTAHIMRGAVERS